MAFDSPRNESLHLPSPMLYWRRAGMKTLIWIVDRDTEHWPFIAFDIRAHLPLNTAHFLITFT